MGRATRRAAACAAAGLLAAGLQTSTAFAAVQNRIDLTVLVVDDGGPATAAITAELASEGTPYTVVKLSDPNRPTITSAFLSDTLNGAPRAKFQGVVLPNENPFGTGSAEMTALAAYEATFGIRQIDAYTYASPGVGLNWAQNPGYIGSLDGTQGAVTTAGLAGPFDYLNGSVPFEQPEPGVSTSYGYLATPLTTLPAGASFTPLVDAPIPGSGSRGSLVGEYDHDSRKELVVTFVYNQYQQQYRLLARGFVDWLTQGIHLGYDRNYFAVHVDDLFLSDDRWDTTLKCTPGDVTCPPGSGNTDNNPIRMTPADVNTLAQWEKANGFTLDFAFNGGGSGDWESDNNTTTDPLLTAFKADAGSFRFINHTWDHPFLGCVQNVTVVPWQCTTDAGGNTAWVDQATIQSEIQQNLTWAGQQGLPIDPTELITGEHSGLLTLPQQPVDNPNLAPALAAEGIKWTGSDASREPNQRAVGSSTLTVPRYPMNVFYNAGHTNEEVDEYNWIYTSKAQGGSGICESSANSTCLPAPLNTSTGYASYIVPTQTRIDLGYVLDNDPRPNFIHQSNFAEDQIAYPVLDSILGTYKNLYAANTPIVNLRESQIGTELQQRSAWNAAVAAGQVTGYRIGGTVTVQAPSGVRVEATMPTGTIQQFLLGGSQFGTAYAGELSGWVAPGPFQGTVNLRLASAATPSAAKASSSTVNAAAGAAKKVVKAPRTTVPAGAAKPVAVGPGDTQRTRAGSLVPTGDQK
ncbi:hypothetical protein ABH930_005592 [Kitasatospora sp. GAS204A]|uniref:hypothetical protein n=1 Tax=unclassified Kitasatospora TaxID=2633591 RepID=UPI0024731297|nr:hypothetical protein [Kitasatospora sp. GAS204B]MDH6119418.1 hypothetical protein [Kitasatospora sp. GAS204B]